MGPACCRVPGDNTGLGICLNCQGLQKREMKGMERGRDTHKARESHRHFGLTD